MSDQEVSPVFGIDLGTTYSCIAYVDEYGKAVVIPNSEGDRTTPSVVQFEEENRVVGKEAKHSAVLTPNQVVEMVKRHMGESHWRFGYNGTEYSAEEISSYILRKLGDDAELALGTPVKEVVITCPAYFGIAQRDATVRAAEIAGLTVREVINEPTAAAIIYGLQNEQDQVVLVYHLGGSTFDITVIEIKGGAITVVATGGDHNLGGRNWDEAVVFYLAEQWKIETGSSDDPVDSEESLQELWLKAEQAKQALTVRQETKVTVTHASQRIGVTLTREKFNELTANLLERTIDFTRTTMDEARSRGFTRFDQILLVGGSTRMPQVAKRLEKEFHLPYKVFDPDEAVAKGAALYGYQILPSTPQLDSTTARNIEENLALLGIADLYALLGRPNTTANAELSKVAEQLYNDMVSRQPKTAKVTVQSNLAGYARSIFKSEEQRKRYDETLRQRSLKEHARARKWGLQVPTLDRGSQGERCGNCHEINGPERNFCRHCNKELMTSCPNCGSKVATDDAGCGKCGFPVGNRYWVDTLLERAAASHDREQTQELLREAEDLWKPARPDARVQKIIAYKDVLQKLTQEKQLRPDTRSNTGQNNLFIYDSVQGVVQGDNNTVMLEFHNHDKRTIPFLAPPLSTRLVGRDTLIYKLKQQLLNGDNLALSALNGLPGVGKTALALALAHDRHVRGHFCDGVLWAGLGLEANVLSHLKAWAIALGISTSEIEQLNTVTMLTQAIRQAIGMRRMFLIIDDAWSVENALAFKLGGPNCAHLVTTRLPEVAASFTNDGIIAVRELDETNSLTLLERLTPGIRDTAPEEARELVHAVGGLPLPLTLMGNYLRIQMQTGQPRRLRAALDRLQQIEERLRLGQPLAGLERHPDLAEGVPLSLLAVIKISDEALDERTRQVLRALAVFPSKPNTFLEDAALAVANASTENIDILADFGLLESSGPGRYTLHQTISDYAKNQLIDIAVYERMVVYYINFVKSYKKDNQRLEREANNILAAVEVMLEQGMQLPGAEVFAYFIRILRKTRSY